MRSRRHPASFGETLRTLRAAKWRSVSSCSSPTRRDGAAARTLRYVASIRNIERDIRDFEGFEVRISGVNRRNLPEYEYGRIARSSFTVDDWKRRRIAPNYPGLDVDVLRPDGRVAPRTMTLARLRAEYETG